MVDIYIMRDIVYVFHEISFTGFIPKEIKKVPCVDRGLF